MLIIDINSLKLNISCISYKNSLTDEFRRYIFPPITQSFSLSGSSLIQYPFMSPQTTEIFEKFTFFLAQLKSREHMHGLKQSHSVIFYQQIRYSSRQDISGSLWRYNDPISITNTQVVKYRIEIFVANK